MLLNLSRGKQDFLKEVVESFANKSGQSALYDALFSSQSPKERSFLGNDDIGNIDVVAPEPDDLARYDIGKLYLSEEILCILILVHQEENKLPINYYLEMMINIFLYFFQGFFGEWSGSMGVGGIHFSLSSCLYYIYYLSSFMNSLL
jgi:hypothetical protein